jgi:hypothetical protein
LDDKTLTVSITGVNDAPTATNSTISMSQNVSRTFAAADFGFNDSEGNNLNAVIITSLPEAGTLKLNNVAVDVNQSIAVADLTKLVYAPAADATGTGYASIGFKVRDDGGTANGGADVSTTANTLTINVAAPIEAPRLTSSLGGVADLDVTSNLVLTSDVALMLAALNLDEPTGLKIHIKDNQTQGTGFKGDVNDNDQTLDLDKAEDRARVSFGDGGKKIIINPKWDLDLSSSYSIEVDAGAFVRATGVGGAASFSANFSTVTPGTAARTPGLVDTDAVGSQIMKADGTLQASKKWFYFGETGDANNLEGLGDLANAGYALVIKNYALPTTGSPDGTDTAPFGVRFDNFGEDDVIYIDSQVNDATKQSYRPNSTPVYANGALYGNQTILEFGKAAVFGEVGDGTARLGLTFEGLTDVDLYAQYAAINTWRETVNGDVYEYRGFANDWHKESPAVIMA